MEEQAAGEVECGPRGRDAKRKRASLFGMPSGYTLLSIPRLRGPISEPILYPRVWRAVEGGRATAVSIRDEVGSLCRCHRLPAASASAKCAGVSFGMSRRAGVTCNPNPPSRSYSPAN